MHGFDMIRFSLFFGAVVVARSFSSIVAVVVADVADVVGRFRWDMYRFTSLFAVDKASSLGARVYRTARA